LCRQEHRIWKREYALRNTETVYGPLFQYADAVLPYHANVIFPQSIAFHKWDEIKRTYQYLTIDDRFRDRLDAFSRKTEIYGERFHKVRQFANNTAVEETTIAFPSYREVYPQFIIKADGKESHYDISESLIRQEPPYISAQKHKKEDETHEYFITLNPIKGGKGSVLIYEGDIKRIFDEMWDRCHKRMEQNSDVQTLRKEYPEMIEEMQSIRKELIRRIQEPWKI